MPKKNSTVLKLPKLRKVTRVALVIDRSYSMESVRTEAFNGINEQINVLKREADKGGDTYVTYIQFDDLIDVVFANRHANELQGITQNQYEPRGSTAMRDAVGRAIETLQAQTGSDEDVAYLVVVISDGQENASRVYTSERLASLVKELKGSGNWTFTMMLSNVDLSVAKSLGVDMGNSVTYTSTGIGTTSAFGKMSESTANYFTARSIGTLSVSNFYSGTDTKADSVPLTVNSKTVFESSGSLSRKV